MAWVLDVFVVAAPVEGSKGNRCEKPITHIANIHLAHSHNHYIPPIVLHTS
jgi:hypothetical protein